MVKGCIMAKSSDWWDILKGRKIKTKILFGFSTLFLFLVIMVIATFIINRDISNTANQVEDVEAPLEVMVQELIGYDAMLTGHAHASLMHAQAGEFGDINEHKAMYDEVAVKLDQLLKVDAIALLEKSERSEEEKQEVYEILAKLDDVNLKLVDLELGAFTAMEDGDIETAYSLIGSEQYHSYKEELYDLYLQWADIENEITVRYEEEIIDNSKKVIFVNLILGGIFIVLGLIVILLVTHSILSPLKKLTKVAEEIGSGNINVKVPVDLKKTPGQVGKISNAFDKLLTSSRYALEKFVSSKVRKR